MFWLIIAVIIVGYFIVKAIRDSSQKNQILIQKQIENNPVYQARYQQSLKYLEHKDDFIFNILERATEVDEQLAEPDLTKEQIAHLEECSNVLYEKMNEHSTKWYKENKDKPYSDQMLVENPYISERWDEQQRKQDELSDRSRQARSKRMQNYPDWNWGVKLNKKKHYKKM